MYIFQTASRRDLLCCMLFTILFTLVIFPQTAEAGPGPIVNSDAWAGYYTAEGPYTEVNVFEVNP
jgi:hypothetical protein